MDYSQHKKILTSLLLCLFTMPVFASTGHFYVSGSVSASQAKIGRSSPEITYYDGNLTDAYPLNSRDASAAVFGFNGGYEFVGAGYKPAIAVGLGVYGMPSGYSYHGQVTESAGGDPASLLYNYQYQVNSTRLMAEAQLTWMVGKFAPFVNAGVGPAWNRTSGYSETAVDSTGYVALPGFKAQTNTNVAYQLGVGVGYAFNFVNDQADFLWNRVSVGYRYADLGQTELGTRGVDYPYQLNTGRLRTNDVYLTFTRLF